MSESCILIVELDVLIRAPLSEYLRECGYHVLEASTASDARRLLNHQKRPIDVVLADVGKGGEAGFALARWIRDNFPAVRVLLAGTISASVEKAGDLCAAGPSLSKPYDHSFVRERIQRLLAGRKS